MLEKYSDKAKAAKSVVDWHVTPPARSLTLYLYSHVQRLIKKSQNISVDSPWRIAGDRSSTKGISMEEATSILSNAAVSYVSFCLGP